MVDEFLKVNSVSKRAGDDFFLDNITFTQSVGQKIALAGETGSGKSTLIKIIAGQLQRDSGEVLFEGRKVRGPQEQLIPGHLDIAYLSQHYELRNHYKVSELIEMRNSLRQADADTLCDVCRITKLLKRRTDQLSGGEKLRVALALQLITVPKLLLLDEPFSNLDLHHKTIIKSVIEAVSEQLEITCLLVSHDPQDVLSWADEMLILRGGRLVQTASPKKLYKQPTDEYVAGLLGRFNFIPQQRMQRVGLPVRRDNKRLLLRPEEIKITSIAEAAAIGVVRRSRFMGGYYELEVMAHDLLLIANSHRDYIIGDKVGIEVLPGERWYL